ncbi:MAG: bifunctional 3-deoxy-7-phosphoheptulonate synthase/chorismate mutase [Deltaproteobacteria bacterium]|nr:bifunctional 3-deoxy-7-phosphoheptulonate synthase/chorismate mutase [Deltaproteobacteria bacterium]
MSPDQLASLRERIDGLNSGLLDLLNQRMELIQEVQEFKARTGRPLFDPARESEELTALMLENEGPMSADQVRAIFKEVFKLSLGFMQQETRNELHVHRGDQPDSVYTIAGHSFGAAPQLIAGPCSVESDAQVHAVAERLSSLGVRFLRGGAFKPRTSPYSFQGLGVEGLRMLRGAADAHGMAVVSEILDPRHLDDALQYSDVLQVGARNMYNYELLKLLGRTDKPVMLKRGFMATLEEFILAAEYIAHEGNDRIILCERGIRTHEKWTRNTLDLAAVPLLRQETPFPVVVDVAHGTGRKDLMKPMAKAALAAGAQGVMVEVHPDPALALSDNAQQMDFEEFEEFIAAVL